MQRWLRRTIPSMYLRRLVLITACLAIGVTVLAWQAYRLTVVRSGEFREMAERRLIAERWTPTVRGSILDRKGRVLAEDRSAFDVMVDYDVITGDWAYSEAARLARRDPDTKWAELDVTQRDALIARKLESTELRLEEMWDALAEVLGIDRAEIDARREEITAVVERMARHVWEKRLVARRAELNRDREVSVEITLEDVAQPVREQQIAHTIATGIDGERVFAVRRLAERYEGVSLEAGGRRVYPYERVVVDIDRSSFPPPLQDEGGDVESVEARGVATHLLGWMRGVFREDSDARPRFDAITGEVDRGHYRPGDIVGSSGVEGAQEDVLRGLRGRAIKRRDTGEETILPPTNGQNVRLTLDIMLQARVQALLDPETGLARVNEWHGGAQGVGHEIGTPLNSSAVVLDIASGDILAAVSMPTFERAEMAERGSEMASDRLNAPLVNRPFATAYMPGSPMKPLVLIAAVTEGMHALANPIACDGHLIPGRPNMLRCWIYKQYGTTHNDQLGHDVGPVDAIGLSCNIYFYVLGRAMGPDRLRNWFEKFGMGRTIELGVGTQSPGNPGGKPDGTPLISGDAIQMGIGQGPVTWTPLQAADAYATMARGGERLLPRIFADQPKRFDDLGLDQDAVAAALDGLEMSVSDTNGTGYAIRYPSGNRLPIFDVPGVRFWGKTGTATAAPTRDEEGNVLRAGDHSWMLLLVSEKGSDRPRYVVSVVVEYGGSGGRVAGPIANQIVYALKAEGYL